MAIYRNIHMSFWTDTKIADEFSPEDKLMFLYLMTNPHTNLCGCYEISERQIAYETGMTENAVNKALDHLEKTHKVISRSKPTKEFLLLNWHKYNWTASEKYRKPLLKQISEVKNEEFKAYLMGLFNGIDSVSIPYQYGSDTTNAVTDTDTDTNADTEKRKEPASPLDIALDDFKEHRRQLKAPMTDQAYKMLLNKLEKLSGGNDQKKIAILYQSIENGWKGVFELKGKVVSFNNHPQRAQDSLELERKLLATN